MIRLDDLLTGKEASPGHDTMSGLQVLSGVLLSGAR